MFKALILVRNFESTADSLDFGEFTFQKVGLGFTRLRQVFSSTDVNQDDWLFEKSYSKLPPGSPGSPVGGIPQDVEDVLLLLRLFKTGDVSFIKQVIIPPSGNLLVQFPYRAMNDINSYSPSKYEVAREECKMWKAFADQIRQTQSWRSDWFATARRFFLSGGAKPFNPQWDDVDRITDYATALEATLVPEKDYNTRRLSNRAAALVMPEGIGETEGIGLFIKTLYETRSRIVHGSTLGDESRQWLLHNRELIELRMRQVLTAAVRKLPPREGDRRSALSDLYDLTDEDRAALVLQKFKEIKSREVRKFTAAKISELCER